MGTPPKNAEITISKQYSLVDEPISVTIRDLAPGKEIEVIAQTQDTQGEIWKSCTKFKANQEGIVDLSTDQPLEGSYNQIDSMGFLWSMTPLSGKKISFNTSLEPIKVTLSIILNGEKLAEESLWRVWSLSEPKRYEIREEGLVGTLFIPNTQNPAPVIITLNGSGGGVTENRAALLSEHGFAVFTLAYFGMKELPQTLENIPIEYFETVIQWIKKRKDIDSSQIGLLGGSKGGELVLLLGTLFPESIQAIGAIVPSCAIFPGCAEIDPGPAWILCGEPIRPIAHMNRVDLSLGLTENDPIWLSQYFLNGINNDPNLFYNAQLPVEKIQCPIMLVSAGDDQMWPSGFFSKVLVERLGKHQKNPTHLNYPLAGHQMGLPYLPAANTIFYHPITKRWYFMGGNAEENELAKRDYWIKLVKFFKETLQK